MTLTVSFLTKKYADIYIYLYRYSVATIRRRQKRADKSTSSTPVLIVLIVQVQTYRRLASWQVKKRFCVQCDSQRFHAKALESGSTQIFLTLRRYPTELARRCGCCPIRYQQYSSVQYSVLRITGYCRQYLWWAWVPGVAEGPYKNLRVDSVASDSTNAPQCTLCTVL